MLEKVRSFIKEKGLIGKGDSVIAAFSGGADSTALLLLLSELREESGFSLAAAHFNHGIRENADVDENFCRALSEELNVPFYSKKANVPLYAEEKRLSIETAARRLRYEFLFELKQRLGADSIATAHHADDSAESILMHLIRGSGLAGLTGIKEKLTVNALFGKKTEETILIRPLLGVTKTEILAFLKKKKQPFRLDETNLLDDAARNYLRLNTIPGLEKNVNPAVLKNICRAGNTLREDEAFLSAIAENALDSARKEGGYLREKLVSLPLPILKRCLRLALLENGVLTDVETVHLEMLIKLLSSQSGASIDLPDSTARIAFDKLIIEKRSEKEENFKTEGVFALQKKAGLYKTPLGTIKIEIISAPPMEKSGEMEYNEKNRFGADKNTALMDLDRLCGPLCVRTRREGDRFRPVNSEWRMKLKDFFISRRVDAAKRDAVPLVLCGGEIVFIPGFLIADCVKLTAETKTVLKLKFFQ